MKTNKRNNDKSQTKVTDKQFCFDRVWLDIKRGFEIPNEQHLIQ